MKTIDKTIKFYRINNCALQKKFFFKIHIIISIQLIALLLAKADNARSIALEAKRKGDETLQEAKDILRVLQGNRGYQVINPFRTGFIVRAKLIMCCSSNWQHFFPSLLLLNILIKMQSPW